MVLLSILIYLVFISLLFFKNKNVFLVVYLFFLFFNDFFFIVTESYYSSKSFYIIKSWRELLFVFLVVVTIYKIFKNGISSILKDKYDKRYFLLILFLLFYALLFSSLNENSILQIILDFRNYFMSFITIILLFLVFDFKEINLKYLLNTIVILTIVLIAFASYEYFSFDGDITKSWKYEFKFEREYSSIKQHRLGVISLKNDFVRDNKFRAGGFFVSTLEYGIFLSIVFLFIFNNFLKSRLLFRLILITLLVFIIYGIFLSQTRTAYIVILIGGIISYFLNSYYYRIKLIYFILPIIIIIILTYSLILLNVGIVKDSSTFARILQYPEFLVNFRIQGLGLGTEERNQYDSFFLSTFSTFGVFAFFYLIFIFYPFFKLYRDYKRYDLSFIERVFILATISSFLAFLYVFTFQHTLSSIALIYLFFMANLCNNIITNKYV
jgi:hypothetical protein